MNAQLIKNDQHSYLRNSAKGHKNSITKCNY